jgi:hypothetical protein
MDEDHAALWALRTQSADAELRNDVFALLDSGVPLGRLFEIMKKEDPKKLDAIAKVYACLMGQVVDCSLRLGSESLAF